MKKQLLLLLILAICTTKVIFAQVPSYVSPNGLIGYWPFNGNANDESGNGLNGTVNGATLTTDRFGYLNSAYSFNGLNNYISTNRNNLNEISVSLWFYTTANIGFSPFVDANPSNWEMYLKNLKPTFTKWISSPSNYQELISTNTVPLSQWHHIVYTYSSNNVKIYLNGVLNSSFTNVTLVNFNSGLYYFGASISGTSQYYNGKLDDIGIWDRPLTDQEITNLYNSANTNECLTMVINTGVLSTNPITYTSTVNIFPNPANDQITIDCGNLSNVVGWNIKITNMLGQEVFNQPMNTQQYVVPLNTWTGQGTYFVKIINAQNEVVNIRQIILQ
ncbi:MAG: T9SS C-terminal target domain-containing protein [Sphingobacteriia bacterium]|nr:T9SS C-terminal target domain-containing protein [Candidatus Fonsibacter lacus]